MKIQPPALVYRADIDGLRALAVVAVILYHFDIGPLGGGFVGVDIFFVISGYLITSIIQQQVERGRFTFRWFYERRIRRLFPALMAVLGGTLAAGAWLLLPSDLALLGKSTAATLSFSSNVFFWRISDYFNSTSEINPLLHTWSLAVEEQFYIGLPLLLLAVHRFARNHLVPILLLVAAASFAGCVLVTQLRPSAAFYLSPFRAWELLAGALLAVGLVPPIQHRLWREIVSIAGLALIVAGVLWIRPGPEFPGWRVMAPVLGTAMVLQAGTHGDSSVHALLRLRPVVYVGLISYSLYLWHWPILVYARYRHDLAPLEELRWPLMAAAFAISALSYHFVELPFRRPKGVRPAAGPLFRNAIVASAMLGVVAVAVTASHGLPGRFGSAIVALDHERDPTIPFLGCDRQPLQAGDGRCRLGADGVSPSILVWGDSHALSWAPAFDSVLRRKGLAARLAVNLGCAPLAGTNNPASAECRDFNDDVMAFLRSADGYRMVVLHASWLNYSAPSRQHGGVDNPDWIGHEDDFGPALRETVRQLQDADLVVWLIGPTPGAPSAAPLRMAMARMDGEPPPPPNSRRVFRHDASNFNAAAATLQRGPTLLFTDPAPWFCGPETCAFIAGGLPLYRDGGHLNRHGTDYVEPFLESSLVEIMATPQPRRLVHRSTASR